MTADVQNNWLAKYPAWPLALLDKFSDEIEIQSNKFFPDLRSDCKTFYEKSLSMPAINNLGAAHGRVNASFSFLNPTNQRYVAAPWFDFGSTFCYVDLYPLESFIGINQAFVGYKDITDISNPIVSGPVTGRYASPYGNFYYDTRLIDFSGFAIFNRIFGDGQTANVSYLLIMSYSSMRVEYLTASQLIIQANGTVKPYNQAESLIALYENGVTAPNVNFDKLKEFKIYLDAYEKYKTQIESDYQLQIQKTAAEINQYEQQLIDKFNAEKSALQNLKLQIGVALSNEAASAKRDFLNLFLNTQNLQVNLGRQ